MQRIQDLFSGVSDPRAANRQHDFVTVLTIALLATLCGGENCSDMADFARSKQKLLRRMLHLPHGVPSHDTFSRVFRHLDPESFAAAFALFAQAFAQNLKGVVAIDGKAVRGAYERGQKTSPLHLVNVWAADARMAIGQHTAPGRNEVKGVHHALKLLSLEGCTVTADALHCRSDTAKAILATGADYALAIKKNQKNQKNLYRDAEALFAQRRAKSSVKTKAQRAHHRAERRSAAVIPVEGWSFPGLKAVARVVTGRTDADGKKLAIVRFFALSADLPAAKALDIARTHWTIENQLHWVLDVQLGEDAARTRKDHGAENLSILRKIALNLLRTHPDKASIRRKIKKAGWDDTFLLEIIAHMR
jgi:predicted transposase YbfD/YdcC